MAAYTTKYSILAGLIVENAETGGKGGFGDLVIHLLDACEYILGE